MKYPYSITNEDRIFHLAIKNKMYMKLTFVTVVLCWINVMAFGQTYSSTISKFRSDQQTALAKEQFGPLRPQDIANLRYFEPDQQYKVSATVEILFNEPTFRMPTYDGTSNEYKRYALLHFTLKNEKVTLTAYQSAALFQNPAYKDHLFLPFLDQTNGNQTYEGGRYIDLDSKNIKNKSIEIDFNKAYNPYCAYSNGYRCPQPPAENHLQLAVEAGEKKYVGPKNERPVNKNAAKGFTEAEKKKINTGTASQIMYVLQVTEPNDLEILKAPSQDIKYDDPLLELLSQRMYATVNDPDHSGVGIAAPQVGINKNAIWVQRFDKKDTPFEFYVNPKIIWRSKLTRKGAEGCLSIPSRKEDVLRSYAIRLQYVNKTGDIIEENIEGFTAVIFQHEVDHLYGILFTDRLEEQAETPYVPLQDKIEFSIPPKTVLP